MIRDWNDDDMGIDAPTVSWRSHKDTRRWCKGRPGREHQPVIVIPENTTSTQTCTASTWFGEGWCCYHVELCSVCGKRLRPWGFLPAEECPDFDPEAARAAVAERAQ